MSLDVKKGLSSKEWENWCVDAYDEHKEMFSSSYRIDVGTWILLASIADQRDVKSIVEFGSGLSTVLMNKLGIEIISLESFPEYLPQLDLKNSKIVTYNMFDLPPRFDVDMAFIDGPGSPMDRYIAYWYVADSSIPLVVCHDTDRIRDMGMMKRYFPDWITIGGVTYSGGIRSMALRRRNESDNKL